MKIALVFDKDRPGVSGIYFARALEKKGYVYDHFWTRDAQKIPASYDLYLRIDHGDYEYDLPKNLRPKAFYACDCHLKYPYAQIQKQAGNYDFVFVSQRGVEVEFKRKGINAFWSPMGCDPEIHKKLDLKKIYDIGFVGTDGGVPRKFYLQELRERYPNSFIGQADYREMSEIYSQAKIGFHYIHCTSKHKSDFSMRAFEIMSCGAMLVMSYIAKEEFQKLGYFDRKNIVIYRDPKELFFLIEYYLNNVEEREKIADQGHRITVAQHSYEKRVEDMFRIMGIGDS